MVKKNYLYQFNIRSEIRHHELDKRDAFKSDKVTVLHYTALHCPFPRPSIRQQVVFAAEPAVHKVVQYSE